MSRCKTGKCYTARGANAQLNAALKAQLDEQRAAERAAAKKAEPFDIRAWQAAVVAEDDERLAVLALDSRPGVAATAAAAKAGSIWLTEADMVRLSEATR